MGERVVIQKVMCLSHTEFMGSMRHLTREVAMDGATSIPLAVGFVEITYQLRSERQVGRLLTLPDAVVTLTFIDVKESARIDFLARFDRTFQRGGG